MSLAALLWVAMLQLLSASSLPCGEVLHVCRDPAKCPRVREVPLAAVYVAVAAGFAVVLLRHPIRMPS